MRSMEVHDVFKYLFKFILNLPKKTCRKSNRKLDLLLSLFGAIFSWIPFIIFIYLWSLETADGWCNTESTGMAVFGVVHHFFSIFSMCEFNLRGKYRLSHIIVELNRINYQLKTELKLTLNLITYRKIVNLLTLSFGILVMAFVMSSIIEESKIMYERQGVGLMVVYLFMFFISIFILCWNLSAIIVANVTILIVAKQFLTLKVAANEGRKPDVRIFLDIIEAARSINSIFWLEIMTIQLYVFEMTVMVLWGYLNPRDSCMMKNYSPTAVELVIVFLITIETCMWATKKVRT